MSVGVVQNGMPPDQKKKAYRCDVTYVTNSELGFDYLRDQMAPSPSELALREKSPFNFAVVDEVDSILIDEARTPLIISGVADNTPTKYKVAQEVVRALKKEVHYTVDEKQRQCVLIEGGVEAAEKLLGKDDLFDPEDPWFPFVTNALNAKELYIKDKAYIVKRGEVMIVDEFTGRVMEGRRWSNGLHQAIEAKENVQIQAESVTLASISYQSLFRLFDKLSGMTGTAFTEAKEFEEVYKLKTVVVPPNLIRKREDKDDQVYVDDIGKWKLFVFDSSSTCLPVMAPMKSAMKAKKVAMKATKAQKVMTKGALLGELANATEMKKADISKVLNTLTEIGTQEVKKSGKFILPGLCMIKTRTKAAVKGGGTRMM
eukprot:symbB.v1.2.024712.t1/scaffold2359.1/size81413/2